MDGEKQHETKMALSINVKSNIQTSILAQTCRHICTLSHTWIINNIYSQCFNVALVFLLVSLCCDKTQADFDLDNVSPHTHHSHHTVTITHTVVCSWTSPSDMLRCTNTLACPRQREPSRWTDTKNHYSIKWFILLPSLMIFAFFSVYKTFWSSNKKSEQTCLQCNSIVFTLLKLQKWSWVWNVKSSDEMFWKDVQASGFSYTPAPRAGADSSPSAGLYMPHVNKCCWALSHRRGSCTVPVNLHEKRNFKT